MRLGVSLRAKAPHQPSIKGKRPTPALPIEKKTHPSPPLGREHIAMSGILLHSLGEGLGV